jgi:hypothetical protein
MGDWVWTCEENLAPTGIRLPVYPSRSKSLYELGSQCRPRITDKVINKNNYHITAYLYAYKERKFSQPEIGDSIYVFDSQLTT